MQGYWAMNSAVICCSNEKKIDRKTFPVGNSSKEQTCRSEVLKEVSMPRGMCYSHYGNGVRNGAISIAQWGLLSDCYKVNPIGQ